MIGEYIGMGVKWYYSRAGTVCCGGYLSDRYYDMQLKLPAHPRAEARLLALVRFWPTASDSNPDMQEWGMLGGPVRNDKTTRNTKPANTIMKISGRLL